MDFLDISYLKRGNPRQKLVWKDLNRLQLWEILASYSPVLAGTFPLEIDMEGSDLDILLEAADLAKLEEKVRAIYGKRPGFRVKRKFIKGEETSLIRFEGHHFPIEIFAQSRPVLTQRAYRHMLVEHKVLTEKGNEFKEELIKLKRRGMKTEPAFALLLGLPGDPYEALLTIDVV